MKSIRSKKASAATRKLFLKKRVAFVFLILAPRLVFAFSNIVEKSELTTFFEGAFQQADGSQSFLSMAVRDMEAAADFVNMLKWNDNPEDLPQPGELYNRKLHFGRWINDPTDDTCYNTRAKILVRDSKVDVNFRGNNKCVVDRGEWHDPYTDKVLRTAREMQIDHLVPLKNAYLSGAWSWDFKMRCLYANYMNESYHLVSVDGVQNMTKGDRGPDAYIPPNDKFTCEYLHHWLAVKLVWKLQMSQAEAQGVKAALQDSGCRETDFRYSIAALRDQRKFISQNLELCQGVNAGAVPKTP